MHMSGFFLPFLPRLVRAYGDVTQWTSKVEKVFNLVLVDLELLLWTTGDMRL